MQMNLANQCNEETPDSNLTPLARTTNSQRFAGRFRARPPKAGAENALWRIQNMSDKNTIIALHNFYIISKISLYSSSFCIFLRTLARECAQQECSALRAYLVWLEIVD
jgi:hypothetical protein